MPRAHAIQQSDYPYNISARCINREWFHIPMPRVWEIFSEELTKTTEKHGWQIHSFVLMSNHFHLIARTPNSNISRCMHYFMMCTSRRLTFEGNRINETFAGRHFKCILLKQSFYLNAYKYNYRNPVTAGISTKVEHYPFSTLPGLLDSKKLTLPLTEDLTFKSDPKGTLEWLNSAPAPEKLEAVRYGLKRPYFKSKKCRKTNKLILSENDTL